MRVRCPNCSFPIELVDDEQFEHLSCPSCGSQLNLSASDEEATASAVLTARIPGLQGFQLLDPIGAGQFGRVWRARDLELERFVAIKLPHNQYLSPEEAAFCVREARAAAKLNHPYIVSVYEVGRHEETVYIVSEFVEGLSLRDWARHYEPDVRQSAELLVKISDALQHAHDRGVVHRDLKPGNILVDGAGDPHVTDFGLAKQEGAELTIAATGQVLGTPAYMAPEQVHDGHQADARSDVYSLGVILYELITGTRPFKGGKRLLLQQVLYDDPQSPRKLNKAIPRDLETICLKAMAKRPVDRYASALELKDDVRRFLADEPILARPLSPPVRLLRWTRRRPAAAATVLLALLVLVLGGWLLFSEPPQPAPTGRPVRVATQPPGAQLLMIPLNRITGVPQRDRAVQGIGDQAGMLCEPGDYLVIAWRDDTTFHEVYRHVPAPHEELPGIYPHNAWRQDGDTISLTPIMLFDTSVVTATMAHVKPGTFIMPTTDFATDTTVRVPEFYVDVHEVTVGQVKDLPQGLPIELTEPDLPDDMALYQVSWNEAMAYAEALGKRLISEEEFQYLVTFGGTRTIDPDGWQSPDATVPGSVTQPALDRLEWERVSESLIGMRSNVLEWTSNWWAEAGVGIDRRVVRGGYSLGDDAGKNTIDYSKPAPRLIYYPPLSLPRLGFRCARSARPQR